jgi:hypothetical protein
MQAHANDGDGPIMVTAEAAEELRYSSTATMACTRVEVLPVTRVLN